MSAVLRVSGVRAGYGRIAVLHGVDLAVEEGSIVSVIGPNGAGKTTLLNSLMGLLPAQGAVVFAGKDITRASPVERLRRGLCLVAERRELFATMSVEDNLELGGFVRRGPLRESLEQVYVRFPRLRERRRQLAGTLSGGERQMLAIGRALMARPRLLMLDEPSLGLAPRIVADMFDVITGLRRAGVSVLLVEQNARAALAISDWGYVLETGRVVLDGPASELAGDARIVETYLGAGVDEAAGSFR